MAQRKKHDEILNESVTASQNSLRDRAERALAEGMVNDQQRFADVSDYVHELHVYQAELEMQADELRRAQTALEISRDEYSELYNQAPVGYLSINSSGVIIKVNETCGVLLGQRDDLLVHKPLSHFIDSRDHALFFAVCKKASTSEQFRVCELRFRRPDKREFYGRLDLVPVTNNLACDDHYRVTLVDVSARREAEEEKLRLQLELLKDQKAESLKRLAGGIAHNFNNILTAVIGNIELMKQTPRSDDFWETGLEQVYHSSLKAAELSTLMLQYLGQAPPRADTLELVESLDRLQAILRSTICGSIMLDFKPDPGPIYTRADPSQLAQVLNNLVANGVEALGDKPGSVTITVFQGFFGSKNLPESPHGEQLKSGEYACIEIADTGCGMDSDTLLHSIDPFFTTKFTGRGLGLSAVWGTVHAHHGYLYIQSTPGEGTTVQVYLPVFQHGDHAKREVSAASVMSVLRGRNVLYVDDDPIIRTIGKALLEEFEVEVLEAEDGVRGVELFLERQQNIACVILDFAMPGRDGSYTLCEIRKVAPDMPVLLVSGYLKDRLETLFSKDKPDAYLQKPFTRETFRNALGEALDVSKSKNGAAVSNTSQGSRG